MADADLYLSEDDDDSITATPSKRAKGSTIASEFKMRPKDRRCRKNGIHVIYEPGIRVVCQFCREEVGGSFRHMDKCLQSAAYFKVLLGFSLLDEMEADERLKDPLYVAKDYPCTMTAGCFAKLMDVCAYTPELIIEQKNDSWLPNMPCIRSGMAGEESDDYTMYERYLTLGDQYKMRPIPPDSDQNNVNKFMKDQFHFMPYRTNLRQTRAFRQMEDKLEQLVRTKKMRLDVAKQVLMAGFDTRTSEDVNNPVTPLEELRPDGLKSRDAAARTQAQTRELATTNRNRHFAKLRKTAQRKAARDEEEGSVEDDE